MEEATELFGLMEGMLRNSEARLAMVLTASAASAGTPGARKSPPKPAAGTTASAGIPDDLLWLAMLGAGAGAGVLAAIAKKTAETVSLSSPPPATKAGRKSS
jgi:hypothetical protein